MTIRRRVEEVDEDGRRKTTIVEEPADPSRTYGPQVRDTEVVGEEEVVSSQPGPWNVARSIIRTFGLWIMLGLAVVEALLGFRLAFLLAGANPNNGFVDFIYDIAGPMVNPFEGISSNRTVDGGVFEPATVIAMAVYLLAALLLIGLLWAATAFRSPAERAVTTRTHHRQRALRED